jgi:hypothetical protein
MQEQEKHSVAVVTGSSSGIGFETSLLLARSGFYTYATMRNTNRSEPLLDIAKKDTLPLQVIPLDVNNDNSVKGIFRHKLVHLSEPAYGFLYNGKRIAWKHDERPTAKHLDIQEDHKFSGVFGQKVWHDKIFIIKISHFKDDIMSSVTDTQNGFLAKIEIDKQMRKF